MLILFHSSRFRRSGVGALLFVMVPAWSAAAMQDAKEPVCLRLMVDEEKKKVLFAEAGKDFMDALLSFLTLPLGTIARLVSKESNVQNVRVGSISSLYESVANLEEKQFWTAACKEMLLGPKNSMESFRQYLKLNIDDTERTEYYICANWECNRQLSGGLVTTFRNQTCKCGKPMNRGIMYDPSSSAFGKIENEGFVPETSTFIISDDLSFNPVSVQNSVCLPVNDLGYEDFDDVKLVTVNVTHNEILDLLKCSLCSATPLTDVFLLKKQSFVHNIFLVDFDIGDHEANGRGQTMKVKIMIRKSTNKILFALGDEDFADFVLSFLTFPLGGVAHMLNGKSYMGSIDNLYKSILDLDHDRYLRSSCLKEKLVKSQLAYQFKLRKQILPIEEAPPFHYFCVSQCNVFHEDFSGCVSQRNVFHEDFSGYLTDLPVDVSHIHNGFCASVSTLEPQSSTGEAYGECGGRGFTKRPSMYMVTDDLIVTPSSPFTAISFLKKMSIAPPELEERVISIGKEEGLSLMKAALISSSALNDGLGPFLKTKNQNTLN